MIFLKNKHSISIFAICIILSGRIAGTEEHAKNGLFSNFKNLINKVTLFTDSLLVDEELQIPQAPRSNRKKTSPRQTLAETSSSIEAVEDTWFDISENIEIESFDNELELLEDDDSNTDQIRDLDDESSDSEWSLIDLPKDEVENSSKQAQSKERELSAADELMSYNLSIDKESAFSSLKMNTHVNIPLYFQNLPLKNIKRTRSQSPRFFYEDTPTTNYIITSIYQSPTDLPSQKHSNPFSILCEVLAMRLLVLYFSLDNTLPKGPAFETKLIIQAIFQDFLYSALDVLKQKGLLSVHSVGHRSNKFIIAWEKSLQIIIDNKNSASNLSHQSFKKHFLPVKNIADFHDTMQRKHRDTMDNLSRLQLVCQNSI